MRDRDSNFIATLDGTGAPGFRVTARQRAAPLHPSYGPSSMSSMRDDVIYAPLRHL
jgi:hypothetical protein